MKIELKAKWRVKTHPYIKFTENRECFNAKTNRRKKITVNGGSIGVWLDNKTFLVKSKLKDYVELEPEKENLPF